MNAWKRSIAVLVAASAVLAIGANENPLPRAGPVLRDSVPPGYVTSGGVKFQYLGDRHIDSSESGFALQSANGSGEVSRDVAGLNGKANKWYRFTFRGLPQNGFAVAANDLYMRASFFGGHGNVSYDAKTKPLVTQIETARRDLGVNGRDKQNGAEAWQTYSMVFSLPFPQVDEVKLAVGFQHGTGSGRDSDFYVSEFVLAAIPTPPVDYPSTTKPLAIVPQGNLLPIGGRWFYAAKAGESVPPKKFDNSNADRLLYHDAGYSAPFAGNTSAYLRPGNKDAAGRIVAQNTLVADNVTLEFDDKSLVLHTHGIPNHPTGMFPEPGFGNPSFIQDKLATYYIPLKPTENPAHRITNDDNSNHALHMGPIGVAVNGVVFFNPFDIGNQDATDLMDRCCGHPNPMNQYHYHKYPVCINSPWADEGLAHSPLIGFAFDGYPVYGPYESANVMAKDVAGPTALNGFNLHYDADRGWHYHATPGKFPYLIGGFWGMEDSRNQPHRPAGGAPGGGAPGRGPPDGPPPPFEGPR